MEETKPLTCNPCKHSSPSKPIVSLLMGSSAMSGYMTANTSDPRIVYVCGFVQHSLSMDVPLETFVALNGDTGDVYSAQCSCTSG